MLAFISFILVIVGSLNWFCIGILQYDFVAGIFGSQSNIFSRLVYTLVGIASIIIAFNLIKNKGKFIVSFKKANKEYDEYMEDKKQNEKEKVLARAESAEDFARKDDNESHTNVDDSRKDNYDSQSEDGNSCRCNDCHCNNDRHTNQK